MMSLRNTSFALLLCLATLFQSCGESKSPSNSARPVAPPLTAQFLVGQWTQYKGQSVIGRDTTPIQAKEDRYYDFRADGKIGFPMQDLDFDWSIDNTKNQLSIGMIDNEGQLQWIKYDVLTSSDSTFLTIQEYQGEQHLYYFRKGWPEE